MWRERKLFGSACNFPVYTLGDDTSHAQLGSKRCLLPRKSIYPYASWFALHPHLLIMPSRSSSRPYHCCWQAEHGLSVDTFVWIVRRAAATCPSMVLVGSVSSCANAWARVRTTRVRRRKRDAPGWRRTTPAGGPAANSKGSRPIAETNRPIYIHK